MISGDFIGTEEEYIPGSGVYLENGKIYAAVSGKLHIDSKRHAVILPYETIPKIKVGSVVFARVERIFEQVAFLSLFSFEKNKKIRVRKGEGLLRISEIRTKYIESIREEIKVGDLIKCEVTKVSPFLTEVSIKKKEFGVIKAFCSICRHKLEFENGVLVCRNCKHTEKRKIAVPYKFE